MMVLFCILPNFIMTMNGYRVKMDITILFLSHHNSYYNYHRQFFFRMF